MFSLLLKKGLTDVSFDFEIVLQMFSLLLKRGLADVSFEIVLQVFYLLL